MDRRWVVRSEAEPAPVYGAPDHFTLKIWFESGYIHKKERTRYVDRVSPESFGYQQFRRMMSHLGYTSPDYFNIEMVSTGFEVSRIPVVNALDFKSVGVCGKYKQEVCLYLNRIKDSTYTSDGLFCERIVASRTAASEQSPTDEDDDISDVDSDLLSDARS